MSDIHRIGLSTLTWRLKLYRLYKSSGAAVVCLVLLAACTRAPESAETPQSSSLASTKKSVGNPILTISATQMPTQTIGADNGDGTWILWANGSVATSVSVPTSGSYQLDVSAYGTPALGGWPSMDVLVDGQLMQTFNVNSGVLSHYQVASNLVAGLHNVTIAFTNDAYAPPEDRNLFVGVLSVSPTADPGSSPLNQTVPVASMYKSTGGDNGGGVWGLWSEGYVETPMMSFSTSAAYQISVDAFGSVCNGVWPTMEIRVDGVAQGRVVVNSTSLARYSINASISAGSHKVEAAFTNDCYTGAEDRNLFVSQILVNGSTSPSPSPSPAPSPMPAPGPATDISVNLPLATIATAGTQQCIYTDSSNDWAKVESWTCWGGYNQRFTITPQANGSNYEISLAGSGKCLQADGSKTEGATVQLFFCYAPQTQLWRIQQRSDGGIQIVSAASGMCLDSNGGANGTQLAQKTCAPTNSQNFALSAYVSPPPIPSSAGASPYIPSGYKLVFNDDFETPELDTSKWWTRYINGGTVEHLTGITNFLNGGQERFGENHNHIMTGSTMKLTAYGTADDWEHPSGMVRSKKTFKYGYFETRFKVPKAHGVFPAFWMVPDATASGGYGGWPPELDMFEYINNVDLPYSPYQLHSSFHSDLNSALPWMGQDIHYTSDDPSPYYALETRFDADFHTIGALWDTDDTITVFIDGRMMYKHGWQWKHEDGSEPPFGHLLLDLAVGGWPGRPDSDWNADPQAFEIDYVRAYQKVGAEQNGVGPIGYDLCPAGGGC